MAAAAVAIAVDKAAVVVGPGTSKLTIKAGDQKTFPKKGATITVECTGLIQSTGKKFWSTKDPGQQQFTFAVGLGQVIRGWDDGFQGMSLGEEARLYVEGKSAYGAKGFPAWGIGPNATLIFDVSIVSIDNSTAK